MTLIIRSLNPPPQARLRQLIMESLGELLGEASRALPATDRLPADTFAAVDAAQRVWIISYASMDVGRALLDGCTALQEVRALLPWLRQARLVTQATHECRLLILTANVPAGAAELCRLAPIDWRVMRFLEVNGEPGVWFEPAHLQPQPTEPVRSQTPTTHKPPAPAKPASPAPPSNSPTSNSPGNSDKPQPATLKPLESSLPPNDPRLSPEEEAFFQHL